MNQPYKQFLLLLLAIFVQTVTAQDGIIHLAASELPKAKVVVEGVVTDCESKVPIEGVGIYLLNSEGVVTKTYTDKTGFYSIMLLADCTYVMTVDASTVRKTNHDLKYLNYPGKEKIVAGVTANGYLKRDYCLTPVTTCMGPFPALLFNTNSAHYATPEMSSWEGSDSVLLYLTKVLKDDPGIIVEVSAHADSREANALQLTITRADKVKADLVKLGISEKRLVCKAYSNKKLLFKDNEIIKLPSKEKKEHARAKNRRVVFKIICCE